MAVEALKGQKRVSKLAAEYGVHPQQMSEWKRRLLEHGAEIFASAGERDTKRDKEEREAPYKTVGQQKVQIDWLKKVWESHGCRTKSLNYVDRDVSIKEQCDLTGLARSSYYYRRKGEIEENLELMRRIDELSTEYPSWGSRKM